MIFKNDEEKRIVNDSYVVQHSGRIYSLLSNRYLKPHTGTGGYQYVTLKVGKSKYRNFSVHRLVAYSWIKNQKQLSEVNHLDGNKRNNKP